MLKKIGFLSLALIILVAAVGFSAQPAAASTCTKWYTVRPGDNLYRIGMKFGVSWTYLAKINHISNPSKIYSGQVLCVSTTSGGTSGGTSSGNYGYPYFFIQAVSRNNTVSITGYNYPTNTKFDVYMGPIGTKGVGGYYVTSFNSGSGGKIAKTFPIPPELYGSAKIAIRTQDGPFYAYNWFWNNNAVVP
jgi:LysM repeat protein